MLYRLPQANNPRLDTDSESNQRRSHQHTPSCPANSRLKAQMAVDVSTKQVLKKYGEVQRVSCQEDCVQLEDLLWILEAAGRLLLNDHVRLYVR